MLTNCSQRYGAIKTRASRQSGSQNFSVSKPHSLENFQFMRMVNLPGGLDGAGGSKNRLPSRVSKAGSPRRAAVWRTKRLGAGTSLKQAGRGAHGIAPAQVSRIHRNDGSFRRHVEDLLPAGAPHRKCSPVVGDPYFTRSRRGAAGKGTGVDLKTATLIGGIHNPCAIGRETATTFHGLRCQIPERRRGAGGGIDQQVLPTSDDPTPIGDQS